MEFNSSNVMCCGQDQGPVRSSGFSRYVAVNLQYVGSQPMVIHGPVTGNIYRFSHLDPVQSVDPRDAVDLLSDRQFRLAR